MTYTVDMTFKTSTCSSTSPSTGWSICVGGMKWSVCVGSWDQLVYVRSVVDEIRWYIVLVGGIWWSVCIGWWESVVYWYLSVGLDGLLVLVGETG